MLNQIELNLAAGSDTVSENQITFSLMPYLTPDDAFDEKTNKRGFKRLRKPVMYDIEPMPDKIEVTFEKGDLQEQAFIGDAY